MQTTTQANNCKCITLFGRHLLNTLLVFVAFFLKVPGRMATHSCIFPLSHKQIHFLSCTHFHTRYFTHTHSLIYSHISLTHIHSLIPLTFSRIMNAVKFVVPSVLFCLVGSSAGGMTCLHNDRHPLWRQTVPNVPGDIKTSLSD